MKKTLLLLAALCTLLSTAVYAASFDRSVRTAENREPAIPPPHMYIDLATVQDVGLAPWLFNLYIYPKEEMTVGHRRNAGLASVLGKLKAHGATFKKYPPKDVGL